MKSPFKFLDSYTKDDREIFFGRDREIEELYQKVFDSKLLLVYGVSGTGKSSLIHCGLANKFLETDWLPLVIRRGGNIIESMASEIKGAAITQQDNNFRNPADFKKGVRSLYLDHYKPVFFILDQFEELFIFGGKEERREFVHIVKTLIESDLQCRFIFVMREEYMAWITEFEKVIPSFLANRVRIEKMSHSNALEAIEKPCRIFNIILEEGFSESLLEKLSPGTTEIELTYLQVFLDKIFRSASSETVSEKESQEIRFLLSLLDKFESVSDLLGCFLDDQIALMNNPDDAMTVLKTFVSGKGTKRPASEAETFENTKSLGKEISPESVTELIQTFVKLRVLRDKDDHGRYELRHDALAEKVYDKFTQDEKELLDLRLFIENAHKSYLTRHILLGNEDLKYIDNKDSIMHLSAELKGYLTDSRKLQLSRVKTIKYLTIISAVIFFTMMTILGYFALVNIRDIAANNDAIRSLSQTKDLKERFQMAKSAWKKNQAVLPKKALLVSTNDILASKDLDSATILAIQQYKIAFDPAPCTIKYAECSKDNKYIFGFGDSLILVWNINGNLERTIPTANHKPILDIKLSEDNMYIGIVSVDSMLTVWKMTGEEQFSFRISYNLLNTKQIFKFFKNSCIFSLSKDNDGVILNNEGNLIQTFDKHSKRTNAIDISPDNRFIATASSDHTINIWYLNSQNRRFEFYNKLTWHKDTVWSVSFSSRNINVISASADSSIITGDINNIPVSVKDFPKDQRYCYSAFSNTNQGLMAISYNNNYPDKNRAFLVTHYGNPTYNPNSPLWKLIKGVSGYKFMDFAFSNEDSYFIYKQEDSYYIADNRLVFESDRSSIFNLLEIKYQKCFFSSDNKYVLAIDKNKIETIFIDVTTDVEIQ